jgi:hypothetical protein
MRVKHGIKILKKLLFKLIVGLKGSQPISNHPHGVIHPKTKTLHMLHFTQPQTILSLSLSLSLSLYIYIYNGRPNGLQYSSTNLTKQTSLEVIDTTTIKIIIKKC